jgi:hypothetical protein
VGGSGTAMKNDRSVVIRITSTAKGVQVKFAVEGVSIELEKQPDQKSKNQPSPM